MRFRDTRRGSSGSVSPRPATASPRPAPTPRSGSGTRPTGRLGSLEGHTGLVRGVVFRPGGSEVVTIGEDATIRVWDLTGDRTVAPVARTRRTDLVPRLHPDGKLLATGGHDGLVKLWNLETGEQSGSVRDGTREIRDLAFNPSGTRLALAPANEGVRVRDLASLRPHLALTRHQAGDVIAVRFSPDGSLLASAGFDAVIRLWTRRRASFARPSKGTASPCSTSRSAPTAAGSFPSAPMGRCASGRPASASSSWCSRGTPGSS